MRVEVPIEEDRFDEELSAFEEESKMQYVTSIERRAIQRGSLEANRNAV
ncbi:MAG: hypothetical protein HC921_21385 [Synechococcaceae cyanobacterium SM2_3_1]|nr:hypothetical protein [Synechococcaceae cyanobacterium SM2_3_1]